MISTIPEKEFKEVLKRLKKGDLPELVGYGMTDSQILDCLYAISESRFKGDTISTLNRYDYIFSALLTRRINV
jgi:hypothetical protein